MQDRLTVLTDDVGGMIRQWTLSSALTHVRSFVSALDPGQHQVEQWIVSTDSGVVRRQERRERMRSSPEVTTDNTDNTDTGGAAADTGDQEMEDVSERADAEETPVMTEIPPPDQDQVFPASLLSVPVLSTPASPGQGSPLPPAWLPIISSDQTVPPPTTHPYRSVHC